ncbi:DUF1816 domain-containing protein [Chroococcidiopsis sp. SAG 2025]|uniref:DUF1816 domain-containing protein n=1 Tax=Chroococcidiopsis sp. SAG 2025 TaxID=171389 RepID=UPI002936DDA1|nr:DUF1816 domain-containing protein [Chroococcidiopsis sp. SAG 2025]
MLIKVLDKIKQFLSSLFSSFHTDWWVKIITIKPVCIYYFGLFSSSKEAEIARPGYVEDLKSEAAQGIKIEIKRCQPSDLTVFNEEEN